MPKTIELSPEEEEVQRQVQLLELQANDLADYQREKAWFDRKKERYFPTWLEGITDALMDNPDRRSIREIKKNMADFAEKQCDKLDGEVNSMLTRTSVIVAAATLLLAAFTFKTSPGLAGLMMTISIGLAGFAFIRSISPMRPPYSRSKKDYSPGHAFHLLVYDDFTRFVMYSMLRDRRTPVIQKYKRAHAIVVPVLVGASFCAMAGLVWTQGLSFFGMS
jgi:hypothetical protein